MNGAEDLGARVIARLVEPAGVVFSTDDDGQWLTIRGPEIAPGEPRVIVRLPDNGREPHALQF